MAALPAAAASQTMGSAAVTDPLPPAAGGDVSLPRDGGDVIAPGDIIEFGADQMEVDESGDVVTASGNVELRRDAWRLTADRIDYNRTTGAVLARGNVISIDPEGNQVFADEITLTDSLKDGAVDNMLLVLNDGGRLAAQGASRQDRLITLRRAVYSPCAVVDSEGCPQEPVWRVRAASIRYDRDRHRLSYKKARLEMFGIPILYLPSFSHPDGEAERVSGLLIPEIKIQRQLGIGLGLPFHVAQAPDRDFTVTPWFYTEAAPALQLQARRLFDGGPIQADAFMTYARRIDFAADNVTELDRGNRFRGYLGVKGRFQHSSTWRSTFSVRLTTDDTFNRRYDLDFDDTLRSTYALERVTTDSYLSISAWAFQGLRATDTFGESPFVLPIVDYDWRPVDTILGGRLQVAANSMNLVRSDGQNVQRALAFGRWERSVYTPLGQRLTATALLRGDLYNVGRPDRATLPEYAGDRGFGARAIPVAALEMEWPFAGAALGGTQTLSPRVQLVITPESSNDGFPNEDSRAIELEDISLFELNRFPGQDRFEGGSRVTYGVAYTLDRPGLALRSEIGQSWSFGANRADRLVEFPAGTGLEDRLSDFVGRTNVKVGGLVEVTHRFRVDRNSFAIRRNEIDLSLGNQRTYATVGYLKLNRNIGLEDLEDRTELRAGGRLAFARFWSVFGSAIADLTTRRDNPNAVGNGFRFVRHRIGAEYEDECFRFGISWRRDLISDRDFRAGSTFQLTLSFKTLGR
ncbi:LPS-assembly protein LptD [Polymorphobacter sp.]|uniref:LPS-assembly protein LptD n=1 Tax=Polymorphobacter sp. TaxID=1909290 RepID=UPI003F6FCB21